MFICLWFLYGIFYFDFILNMALSGANYVKDESGTTFIAASQRPDGTWRKQRRVKEGYVPQEEVPLYESRGKQFVKNVPQYPPGLSEEVINASKAKREKAEKAKAKNTIPGLIVSSTEDKTTKKKKKKKNQEQIISESLANSHISSSPSCTNNSSSQKTKQSSNKNAAKNTKSTPLETKKSANQESDLTSDPTKRLRNLRKKLRDIESLEQKIASGELKTPDKDQLSKISRKNEVLNEISELLLIVGTE